MNSKQEIRYLPPGEEGTGKIWQFNRLTPINEQYELANMPMAWSY